ncbi:hypothetical protein [Flagellimonas marina]|uniref:Fibronectin type-III domain-containing protein n=1 Tax=Flagellimonas marina TaxID=1775168 RepID=A0ABV8PJ95_9FLAO
MLRQTSLVFFFLILFSCSSDSDGPEEEVIVIELPSVTTGTATNITINSVEINGNVTNDGGGQVTSRGFVWDTSSTPTMDNNITTNGTGEGVFNTTISNLEESTEYFVRAYATNSEGTSYGNEVSFETGSSSIVLTTLEATEVSESSAVSGGSITINGEITINIKGLCWSTEPNPTIENDKTEQGDSADEFQTTINGLSPNTTYYARSYVISGEDVYYGNQISFTTEPGMILLSTKEIIEIGETTAKGGGTITDTGGTTIIARGVCWSTAPNPTVDDSKTEDGDGDGEFESTLSGLLPYTEYYVRAYATNSEGTVYANEVTFTTLEGAPKIFDGDVVLESQQEVDDFGNQGYSEITGSLFIGKAIVTGPSDASDISSLTPLSNLETIGSTFTIYFNPDITGLDGLLGLTTIGGDLVVRFNNFINNLDGLNGLTEIGGKLEIQGEDSLLNINGLSNVLFIGGSISFQRNDSLGSIAGLQNLTEVNGSLELFQNPLLTNLDGLLALRNVKGDFWINGSALDNLTALNNLETVEGNLRIETLANLEVINGFDKLTSVSGDLRINGNASLLNIQGFSNLNDVESMRIDNNPLLAEINDFDALSQINGDLYVFANSLLTNIDAFQMITSIGGNVRLSSNHLQELGFISNLTTIGGNLNIESEYFLPNINELNNLETVGGSLVLIDTQSVNVSFENLNQIGGSLIIRDNGWLFGVEMPSLVSVVGNVEIIRNQSTSFNLDVPWGLTSIGGDLMINFNNSEFNSLQGLYVIHAFENLNNLSGDIEITWNGGLENLCGLQPLLLNGYSGNYLVEYNRNNPTQQDIINGNCSIFP